MVISVLYYHSHTGFVWLSLVIIKNRLLHMKTIMVLSPEFIPHIIIVFILKDTISQSIKLNVIHSGKGPNFKKYSRINARL